MADTGDADRNGPMTPEQRALMRTFTSFLDSDNGSGPLINKIHAMIQAPDEETVLQDQGPKRLIISIDELRDFDAELARDALQRPVEHIPIFEKAMHEIITARREDLDKDRRKLTSYRIGIDGSFGSRLVSPRALSARLVGGMVSLEGIVTRCSTIRPKLVRSVHYCPTTAKFLVKSYRDNASVSSLAVFTQNAGLPGSGYPTKDEEGNALETEFGKCWYRDSQSITVQEMPERSPPGELPRSVDVLIEADLCDACKPGDRVRINGVFRALGTSTTNGRGSGVFKTVVVANHVTSLTSTSTTAAIPVLDSDVGRIRSIARSQDAFDVLSRSIAPSICGHEYIKKALLLQLIGGRERNLANGTHLRGDINIMMVGDPSTAKSQLLRFILNTAPLAISTTGRGSSGVGLTAAVTSDPDTGERHLEAGAMVLADRGVVCIDEFDKMSDEDRVAIHEVMEQQTVTIAKAGIHASLNARCSVTAAANPVYGNYDKSRKPHENIALPDSLLSRFDLLFIVLDSMDKDRDRQIADHVLRAHRFRTATQTLDAEPSVEENTGTSVPIYESAASAVYNSTGAKVLSVEFLKRYIHYAKTRHQPSLTPEAATAIAEQYQTLRQELDRTKTLPITARCLETLIRLATAHAKCRLDKSDVTKEDADVAVDVLRYALHNQADPNTDEKEYKKKQARARRRRREEPDEDDDTDTDGDDEDDLSDRTYRGSRATRRQSQNVDTNEATQDSQVTGGTRGSTRKSVQSRGGSSKQAEGGSALRNLPQSEEAEAEVDGMQPRVLQESEEAEILPRLQESEQAEATVEIIPVRSEKVEDKRAVERVMKAVNAVRGRQGTAKVEAIITWLAEEEDEVDAEPLSTADVKEALQEMQRREQIVMQDDNIFIV